MHANLKMNGKSPARGRRQSFLWFAAAVVLLGGCGGEGTGDSRVEVTGKIVKDGVPLKVAGMENGSGRIEIIFVPVSGEGETETRLVQADGTFTQSVASGKYKLAVKALEIDPESFEEVDKLGGAFSPENTPLEREITAATDLGTIDLAKPNG